MNSHKYRAKRTTVDGITFDSKKESLHYLELKQKEKLGHISELTLQPRFVLQEKFTDNEGNKIRAIEYVADFSYKECGRVVVHDVKGFENEYYKLKEKLFRYKYREYIFRKS